MQGLAGRVPQAVDPALSLLLNRTAPQGGRARGDIFQAVLRWVGWETVHDINVLEVRKNVGIRGEDERG
jgi:hypothetical protein